jgi:Family of unknown function (DUF5681)
MSQFQKGQSGNPSGRPPGRSLQSRLREAVDGRFDELVGVLVNAAAGGDMAAMTLLLNRLVPALRPVQDPVPFALSGTTLTEKGHSILDSVASGEISAQDGKLLLDAVSGIIRIQDGEQLSRQLELIKLQLDADTKMKGQRR